MQRLTILLDVGGVIVDQHLRAQQWPRLVGDVFAARLGGIRETWIEAHLVSTHQLDQAFTNASASSDFRGFLRSYHRAWVQSMCALVGMPVPPDAECQALASRAIALVSARVRATLPGAVESVRTLHCQGYPLHTASGASSIEITGYLQGMGVRACFGRPYGADLLNAFKEGPDFYRRLFADLGIEPGEVVVVDDSAEAIAWAAHVGARTVLVQASSQAETGPTARIASLADLPAHLQRCD